MGLEPRADFLHPHAASRAVVGESPHLDELVGLQGTVDLGHDLVGEAFVADDDDWIELVRLGAQGAAPCGGKGRGHFNADLDGVRTRILR